MSTRLTIYVEDDIPEKLLALANGQRKQGEYFSQLIRAAWSNQHVAQGATLDGLKMQVLGVIAELHTLQARLTLVEGQMHQTSSVNGHGKR